MASAEKQIRREEKYIGKEEKWLLNEVVFLRKFEEEIDEIFQLKRQIDRLTQVHGNSRMRKVELLKELLKNDLKKLPKIERKVGRSERRRLRHERRVLGKVATLQRNVGDVDDNDIAKTVKEIQVFSARILSEVSLRVGKISELINKSPPNLTQIAKHTKVTLEAANALIALLERFKGLVNNLVDYHSNEDIANTIKVHNPILRNKILRGKAPLFYYHGTKPQFVKPILSSGILAPEMRLKISNNDKFDAKLSEEVRLYMRMRRTPTTERLRKDYLNIPSLLHDDKFNQITTVAYSRGEYSGKLQSEMFPSKILVTQKSFYPYFDDDLSDLFFKKYEKFYVKRLHPEQFEHLSRKINKLVEKRIQVIYEIGKSKRIFDDIVEEYVLLLRKAYAVIPHFEFIHGSVNIKKEDARQDASGSYRWVVRKDKWFLYFAAEPPYELYIRYKNLVSWFLGLEKSCIFEFKPTLYNKIGWKFMGDNLYTGELQYDIVSTAVISLAQYCSRIYCNPGDIEYFKKLVKRHGLQIEVHVATDQKRIYEETFARLKG